MNVRAAGLVGLGLLLSAAAWGWQPAPSKAVAERIKRDAARCKHTQNLEACDDAVRWNPSDPALLVAFGDALMRTQHPADALRQYQRAAALAPKTPGVGAKISAAEARLPGKHAPPAPRVAQNRGATGPVHIQLPPPPPAPAKPVAKPPVARNVATPVAPSFSNEAAESHSH